MSQRSKRNRENRRFSAYLDTGGRCFYCGKQIGFESMTLDHVFPKSLGGNREQENFVCACAPCNKAKDRRILTGEELRSYWNRAMLRMAGALPEDWEVPHSTD